MGVCEGGPRGTWGRIVGSLGGGWKAGWRVVVHPWIGVEGLMRLVWDRGFDELGRGIQEDGGALQPGFGII